MIESTPDPTIASPQRSREWLTWTILLLSFTACLIVTVSIPFGISRFVQQSQRRLLVWGLGTSGKPSTTLGSEVLLPGAAPIRYRTPIGMLTGEGEEGIFKINHPDSDQTVARIEVLGGSNVNIDTAAMPRFGRSAANSNLTINLNEGRIRLTVVGNDELRQPLNAVIIAPNGGQVIIDSAGVYKLAYEDEEMQLSVYEGHAFLRSTDDELQLQSEERGILGPDKRTTGPFLTEQNLIKNGDFSESYHEWTTITKPPEQTGQPPAQIVIDMLENEAAAHFLRDGTGNASVVLRQSVKRSIADIKDMRLNITLNVIYQSLGVCGIIGSECPLTVRIDFLDEDGQPFAWEQGFYAEGEISESTPNLCVNCGLLSLSEHQRLPQTKEVYPIELDTNLMQVFEREGVRPSYVESISLIAEGHSFSVDVLDVELMVSETVDE